MSAPLPVQSARLALRHRALLDVVDLGVRFVIAHPAPIAALSAVVLVPAWVLLLVIAVNAGWIWGWVAAIAIASIAELPFTVLASRLVFEEDVAFTEVLGVALRAVPKVLVARLLALFAIGFAATMFVLPGIWLASVLVFLAEVVVLERATITGALSRCQRLVAGEFGDALLTLLVVNGLHFAATVLGDSALRSLLGDVLQITPPPSLWDEGGGVVGSVAFFLFIPFAATIRLLCYLNVRTRAEGWDVQTRFAALMAREAES